MKRLVLDTNTVISAQFWKGPPRTVYDMVKARKCQLLSSTEIETELIRVLGYPKFGLSAQEILPIINDYNRCARKVDVTSHVEVVEKDLTDNIFLSCAVDGHADYVVSGDHHLLELQSYQDILIVTANQFLQLEGLN